MKQALQVFSIFFIFSLSNKTTAQNININGPAGSQNFGNSIILLTNGNYVINDSYYDEGAISDVGAVYLYDGSNHTLISTLKGSTANDQVGGGGVLALNNGNYVVRSSNWDNGAATDAGAITFCSGTAGVNAVVSNSNSLVGSSINDQLGADGLSTLSTGNYLVVTKLWNNGAIADVGAVTFGNGTTGVSGVISSSNSLVGSTAGDQIGYFGVILLSNGNYVVRSAFWDNGAITDAGAATFGNGTTGTTGTVSSSNSLVGSLANDAVGVNISLLSNGNYLAISSLWNSSRGAVTFGSGTSGITGVVSSANSLVGSTTGDISSIQIFLLSNGNYLVRNPTWDNGAATDAGAVTFGNGTSGVSGVISSSNSLVGSNASDGTGSGLAILSNGNYVVRNPQWDNGAATNAGASTFGNSNTGVSGVISSSNSLVGSNANDAVSNPFELTNGNYVVSTTTWNGGRGAATFCNGTTGVVGVVSSSNSLVGSTANDGVGFVTPLTNGNYVVRAVNWDNGAVVNVGAVTFGNGTTGVSGVVSSSNSLVGSVTNDNVAGNTIIALNNGNYLVSSTNWDNGAATNAGAVTFGNGATGISGAVSSSNSLIGSTTNDNVSNTGIFILANGNYVVVSQNWDNGAILNVGAATFGNGATGISGTISNSNSLIGNNVNDAVGSSGIVIIPNGNYVVRSPNWYNGANNAAGAVTFGNGSTGVTGVVSSSNSLVGSTANDRVGNDGVFALNNGNYVVRSINWDNGAATEAGAVTFGNSSTGISGVVSSSNSLVGGNANDAIGSGGITFLSNGNYVVRSNNWDNGAATNAGAITFGNGTTGISGVVSSSNSLVGSTNSDLLGTGGVTPLSNGNYLVFSNNWDNGASTNAGAVTWGNGSVGVAGIVTNCNSVLGTAANGGSSLSSFYNTVYDYLMVGRFSDKIVTIYNQSGMALANTLDVTVTNINGTNPVPLTVHSGCRIIATLTPNGATPVKGTVNAHAWVETAVPTYAGLPFVARHFEITPVTNPTGSTGKVTFYFTQQEFTDFNNHAASILDLPTGAADAVGKSNLRIGKYAGQTNNGTGLPGSYTNGVVVLDPADGDIVWNSSLNRWELSVDVTGFSGFIVQTASTVLPLTLLEFNGHLVNSNGLLYWKTTVEQNTASFDIERSTDGRNYTTVGNVAAYNTAGIHQYNYTDNNITALGVPVVYYRLKQKDIDGRYTYSRIVALLIDNSRRIVLFYPNPVISEANLTVTTNRKQQLQAKVIDNAGRVVKQQQWNVTAGSTTLFVDVSSLSKGVYYLELRGETINERKQFVKQ